MPLLKKCTKAASQTARPPNRHFPSQEIQENSPQLKSRSGKSRGATRVQQYSPTVTHWLTTLTHTLVHPTLMRYCGQQGGREGGQQAATGQGR